MGLKQLIKQQRLLKAGIIGQEFEIPGEPLIYSIKYIVGARKFTEQYFRNEKWKSLIKCIFPAYYYINTPVVLIVRFYVSPPSYISVKKADLKSEKMPAVRTHELCDYILSFQEVLFRTLVHSHRQFVKIDAEKYFSANPRTVFKFMKWDHYVNLQSNNTVHAKCEGVVAGGQV